MHGRIFAVSFEGVSENHRIDVEDTETWAYIARMIPGMDYVVESETFEEDLEWFREYFGLSDTCTEKKNGYAVVNRDGIARVKAKLQEETEEKIKKIMEYLKKRDLEWALWKLRDSDFYYWIAEDHELCPDWKLLDALEKRDPERMFIVGSYDYHV